jgi:ankyrin
MEDDCVIDAMLPQGAEVHTHSAEMVSTEQRQALPEMTAVFQHGTGVTRAGLEMQGPEEPTALAKPRPTDVCNLHVEAENGHVAAVSELLRTGVDANQADCNGRTALHFAAKKRHAAVVSALLGHEGIQINAANRDGVTPLHCATSFGHVEIVTMLLGHIDTDINKQADKDGLTALHFAIRDFAAESGYGEIVTALLGHKGIDLNRADWRGRTALHCAIELGRVEIVTMLLGHIDVNKVAVTCRDGSDCQSTALNIAARIGRVEIVAAVLRDERLEINEADLRVGLTALHYAVQHRLVEIVTVLLGHKGIDLNKATSVAPGTVAGLTALHAAAKPGHVEILAALLRHERCDVNKGDNDGLTALHYAVQDFRCSEIAGLTALHAAAKPGHVEILAALLRHERCDVNKVDNDGLTALHYAVQDFRGSEIVTMLLGHKGIDVNKAATVGGLTALHFAARIGHDASVTALLRHERCDVNKVDSDGLTALHYAVQNQRFGVVSALLGYPGTHATQADRDAAAAALLEYENRKLRAEECERQIQEAFGLALASDAAGLRRMLEAGKAVNGVHPYIGHRCSPIPNLHSISGESPGDDDHSVLHAAIWNSEVHSTEASQKQRRLEVVRLLLEADGCDLSAKTRYGFTPLHYAGAVGDADLCTLLVESGADYEAATVVSKYARSTLERWDDGGEDPHYSPCRHKHDSPWQCHGMPVDTSRGAARSYLESLAYLCRRDGPIESLSRFSRSTFPPRGSCCCDAGTRAPAKSYPR